MDFLKKHYEKVVLTVALLLLIVAAVYLAFQLGETGESAGPVRTTGETVPVLDISTYTNAIAFLNNPPQWFMIVPDLFGQPPSAPPRPPAGTNDLDGGPPVSLLRVAREPFKPRFYAYSWDAQKKEGYNFQINFRDFRKSFFVPAVGKYVQDDFENTGYKITKFERKTTNVVTNVGSQELDISELTLKHEGEEPILLVWGKEAEQKEPVAIVQCIESAQTLKVARGQRLACAGKTYIVVDINQTQMIIVDTESGKKHTIGLTGSR